MHDDMGRQLQALFVLELADCFQRILMIRREFRRRRHSTTGGDTDYLTNKNNIGVSNLCWLPAAAVLLHRSGGR